jgi:acetyl esterase/lipase
MLIKLYRLRKYLTAVDNERDSHIPFPKGVVVYQNLRYKKGYGRYHLLDVYRPKEKKGPLPLLVVVHGGSWLYGTKDTYKNYAAYMASLGFAVICFSYVLAPRKKFPYQMEDLDDVLLWAKEHDDENGFNLHHVFLSGDSSGACMAAQYAIINDDPNLKNQFSLQFPLQINGLILACGVYSTLGKDQSEDAKDMWTCYLGRHFNPADSHYELLNNMTSTFPPSFVFSAEDDIASVSSDSQLLDDKLTKLGIKHVYKIYRSHNKNKLKHVFHCNITNSMAKKANNESADFLKSLM